MDAPRGSTPLGHEDTTNDDRGTPRPVASTRHTLLTLGVLVVVAASGAVSASRGTERAAGTHLLQYATLIVMEWLLFLFVLRGLRAAGTPLGCIIGRRDASWRVAWKPVVAAAVFWGVKNVVLLGVARGLTAVGLHGTDEARRVAQWLLPETPLEAVVWVVLSISAGFCEEVLYRGYLQRQFAAFTRHTWLGVVLSALVFGVSHAYQGLSSVIRITVYGALFGALAALTRSLRPGILAHAAEDIVSGLQLGR